MKPLLNAVKESKCFIPGLIQIHKNLNERINLIYGNNEELGQGIVLNFSDEDWEHLCFGIEEPNVRVPTYEEMCNAKDIFWYDNEITIQVHPKECDYVNIYEMLHLWRNKRISEKNEKMLRTKIENAYKHSQQLQNDSTQYIIDFKDNIKKLFIYCGEKWFSWDEICKAKQKYFGKNKAAIQFNIGKEFDLNPEHIMILWDAEDFILPPKEFV